MPPAPITVTGFSHVAISVTDLDAARAFYCGVLGFEELPRPDLGIPGMWLKVGDLQLHFVETDEMPTPGRGFPHYALHVPTDDSTPPWRRCAPRACRFSVSRAHGGLRHHGPGRLRQRPGRELHRAHQRRARAELSGPCSVPGDDDRRGPTRTAGGAGQEVGRARRRPTRSTATPATTSTAAMPTLCSTSAPVKGRPPEDGTDEPARGDGAGVDNTPGPLGATEGPPPRCSTGPGTTTRVTRRVGEGRKRKADHEHARHEDADDELSDHWSNANRRDRRDRGNRVGRGRLSFHPADLRPRQPRATTGALEEIVGGRPVEVGRRRR